MASGQLPLIRKSKMKINTTVLAYALYSRRSILDRPEHRTKQEHKEFLKVILSPLDHKAMDAYINKLLDENEKKKG